MPCYKPLSAWRQPSQEAGGKSTIVFGRDHLKNFDVAKSIDLPCGQCIGCRLERSRRWAVRLMHEAELHSVSSFLTLTYSDDELPPDNSLRVDDFQKFMKRLRRGSSGPLRFFHCGEYGDENLRPHYHVCLFGEDFSVDRVFEKKTRRGDSLYSSPRLSEVWGLGHAWIGDLTFESAAYVACYCLKKVSGSKSWTDKKGVFHPSKDEHYGARKPEYTTMSKKPGIGANWLEAGNNLFETYRDDSVVMRGKEMMPPPYYDKLLERVDPALFERVKRERVRASKHFAEGEDSRSRRLLDRRIVKEQTVSNTLKRSL